MISGWVCEAERIDIVFNPGTATEETWRAGYRTTREDTEYTPEGEVLCGDTDNGFGLLYNWNRLDDGVHTVSAWADGGRVWPGHLHGYHLGGKTSGMTSAESLSLKVFRLRGIRRSPSSGNSRSRTS